MSLGLGRSPGRPRISWHRGGAELAPSASLSAFSSAAARGAELIEVDVRQTADGALVCVHDPALPGAGSVEEWHWGEVGPNLSPTRSVFDLERFLAELDEKDPGRSSRVHLDLKETGYEERAVGAVLAHGRLLTVTTGHASSIQTLRRAYPDVPALLTIGRSRGGLGAAELVRTRAKELFPFARVDASGATGLSIHYALATVLVRRWCRWRGLELIVWTIDGDRSLRRFLALSDVDVVTTNRPLAALAIRDSLDERSRFGSVASRHE